MTKFEADKIVAAPRASRVAKSSTTSALAQAGNKRDSRPAITRPQKTGRKVMAVRSGPTGTSEVWQARIGRDLAEQLRADAEILGLEGRTDIVKAALDLLHKQAAEERMAQSVEEFYGGSTPPLPLGVV